MIQRWDGGETEERRIEERTERNEDRSGRKNGGDAGETFDCLFVRGDL